MGRPLDGVEAKLQQAKRHMQAFDHAYKAIREADPIRVRIVPEDVQVGRYLIEAEHFPDLTPDLAVIVGDAVHCFRSALDHLVWEAGRQNVGKGSDRSQYPICKNAADFRSQCSRIADLPSDQQAIVEATQPYNRGGVLSPLSALGRLSNTDKHRVLNPMLTEATYITVAPLGVSPIEGINCTIQSFEWIGTGHSLQVGAKVARLEVVDLLAGVEPQVSVYGAFIPDVAFQPSGQSVILTLLMIGSECVRIARQFEQALDGHSGLRQLTPHEDWRSWPSFSTWP